MASLVQKELLDAFTADMEGRGSTCPKAGIDSTDCRWMRSNAHELETWGNLMVCLPIIVRRAKSRATRRTILLGALRYSWELILLGVADCRGFIVVVIQPDAGHPCHQS